MNDALASPPERKYAVFISYRHADNKEQGHLAEPHYLTPLEPPNAIGDANPNRQYELTLGLAEDCFLGARLLINDRTGQTRTTDPKRIELAKQVLARAVRLARDNEAYRNLAVEMSM